MKRICTTTGPYKLVRNPIYIGNFFIAIGLVAASGVAWMIPVEIIVCLIVFPMVVAHEERKLVKMYGDEYVEYLKSSSRWIPKFNGDYKLDIGKDYLYQSIKAELYNFLLLVPMLIKNIIFKY